jgi:hypothetical protein
MNGERGTFRLCDSPGCSEGSRSVGRSDLHTGAGFFVIVVTKWNGRSC